MRTQPTRRTLLIALSLSTISPAAVRLWAAERVPDFCFLQVSDLHISPLPAGSKSEDGRSVDTIAWVCEEAGKPQKLGTMTTPPPAFVVATGDVTEFGVIATTFDAFERYFKPLPVPLYITPGNHDNTWTGMLSVMRRKYGGDHYSFNKFGCHFAAIDSASPQEPLPCLEQRTLTWLEADLKKVGPTTPVFLFCHHPLSTSEYAKPFEQLRFLETIRGYNVVALLMGHGHSPVFEKWGTLDSVEGGSTFGANTGYSIISVKNGILRVVYRFKDVSLPMKPLLEKPLFGPPPPTMEITSPTGSPKVSGEKLPVRVALRGGRATKVTATVDDEKDTSVELSAGARGEFEGAVSLAGLAPGAHFLRVTANLDKLALDRALSFVTPARDGAFHENRITLASGMKAGPIIAGDDLVVSTTAGEVIALGITSPARRRVLLKSGGEILWVPALVEKTLYVSSGDGSVYAVGVNGKLAWKCPVGAAVYGTPAVDADSVYVADMEGFFHAIDRGGGKLRWSKHHAQFSIEQPVLLHESVLYAGSWDGYIYAVDSRTGDLKWKKGGPQGQGNSRGPNRYYAPADCPPVIVGERLYMADRAYMLGAYALDGEYAGKISDKVAAISASADGKRLYVRASDSGLACYDAAGKQIWSNQIKLGRFPIPPTEANGKLYVCSNRGTLSVHDSATGRQLLAYQVTPDLHVMSPPAVDASGNVWVTAMDGTVTQVQP